MDQHVKEMQEEMKELKRELAAKRDEIRRQENSDFADERVVKSGISRAG